MFDISATELLLCMIVALIVLGPEKLPVIARTIGRWTGQAKSYLRNLSSELDRESQASELKKQLLEAQAALREQSGSLQEGVNSIQGAANKILSDTTNKP